MIGPESLSPNIPTEEKLSSQKTPEEIADKLQSFTNVVDKSNYWKKLSPEKRQAVISFLTTENQKDTDKKTQNTDKKTQNTEKKHKILSKKNKDLHITRKYLHKMQQKRKERII